MYQVNIHDAKTNLSRYIQSVLEGETITLCRNGEPVAQLIPIEKPKKRILFGLGKGKIDVDDRFFEPLTDADLPGFGL